MDTLTSTTIHKLCLFYLTFLFLTYETEFVLFFSGVGKFCLTHGLRQLTYNTKIDVSGLQTTFTHCNEKLRIRSELAIIQHKL